MDKILEEGYSAKDLNSKIYKVKEMINGPKIKAAEPMCINNPTTGELITDIESIKEVNILTKQTERTRHGRSER